MKYWAAILLLFFPLLIFAQNYKLNQRYPGYFINGIGDTIRGFILLANKLDNQRMAEYSNDAKGEKIKIRLFPNQIRGFKVQDRVYTAVTYGERDPLPEHFLLVISEGETRWYQYFWLGKDQHVTSGSSDRPATGDDEMYLQFEFVVFNKSGRQFVISNASDLAKHADSLFGDDPEMVQKIKDKEKGYRFNDLPELVKLYSEMNEK